MRVALLRCAHALLSPSLYSPVFSLPPQLLIFFHLSQKLPILKKWQKRGCGCWMGRMDKTENTKLTTLTVDGNKKKPIMILQCSTKHPNGCFLIKGKQARYPMWIIFSWWMFLGGWSVACSFRFLVLRRLKKSFREGKRSTDGRRRRLALEEKKIVVESKVALTRWPTSFLLYLLPSLLQRFAETKETEEIRSEATTRTNDDQYSNSQVGFWRILFSFPLHPLSFYCSCSTWYLFMSTQRIADRPLFSFIAFDLTNSLIVRNTKKGVLANKNVRVVLLLSSA